MFQVSIQTVSFQTPSLSLELAFKCLFNNVIRLPIKNMLTSFVYALVLDNIYL